MGMGGNGNESKPHSRIPVFGTPLDVAVGFTILLLVRVTVLREITHSRLNILILIMLYLAKISLCVFYNLTILF